MLIMLSSTDDIVAGDLLAALVRHRGLRKVVFTGVAMSFVAPGQLARALEGLEEVDIVDTFLDGQQIEAVLGAINGQTRLAIRSTDLSSPVEHIKALFQQFCDHIGLYRPQILGVRAHSLGPAHKEKLGIWTLHVTI